MADTNINAGLPTPQSYEQNLSDMLATYSGKVGTDDFNVGSAVTSFFETVALTTARAAGDVFQILRDFSIDRATGDALQRLATENNVSPITAKPASGYVSVVDTSFQKVSTQIYAGSNPPNIGSTTFFASSNVGFPASGSIYIGRGTPNIEGPISYTSIVAVGGYFQFNLSSPTSKFHNLGESVILAQGGNRAISTNAVVVSAALGTNPAIQFSVSDNYVILDGETEVDNVAVVAMNPGSTGNVPAGAITNFSSPPFSGATVTNPLSFTNGQDTETDDSLRVRVKNALASKGLGTATAVKAAVLGASSPDGQNTVVSNELVLNTNGSATLYIDNGKGYEAQSSGVGLEFIVNRAIGGEQFFKLSTGGSQAPVAKAYLQSTLAAPFDLRDGDTLAVNVGGVVYQHVFASSDFINPGGATSFEVTASINGNTTLGFEATTAGGGLYVVIRAKAETNDSLKIGTPTTSGRNAATLLGFPASLVQTLRLYKNNIPLNKDGQTATVFSTSQSLWSNTIQNGDTLILTVDGTPALTYTVTDGDFISTGLYTSVSAGNSLQSWQQVLQNKLTGVSVSISGQQLEISSNLGANNRAQVSIDPSSTLVTKGMFSASIGLSSLGKSSDFTLSRNTAQFELTSALAEGDVLSAGSTETTARIQSAAITGGAVTFTAEAYFWLLADSVGQIIPTGVSSNSVLVISKPSTNVVRYTSSIANAFVNVVPGDYVIVWSGEINANNRLEGRVHATTSTTLDILVTSTEYAAAVPETDIFLNGFVVLRSVRAPQKFAIPAGTYSLDQIAQMLQGTTDQLIFSVLQEESLIIRTTTTDPNGYILVVTADSQGKLLSLPVGTSSISQASLIAFNDSENVDGQIPLFIHDIFAADSAANPPDSYIASATTTVNQSAQDPNFLVGFLHPYGSIRDAQPAGELDQVNAVSGTTINLHQHQLVRRIRANDRYFLANPLDFGNQDTMTVILDNDPSTESFSIPFYRRAITNTSQSVNPNNFNAYDVDAGSTVQFSTNFGAFDFSNFKALMQAKKVLKPSASQTAILYRADKWGRSGEYVTLAYVYPSAANSAVSSTISVGETVDIRINLKSGAAVPSSIDFTTQWNVSITPNTPVAGVDQVTYTYSGTGTAPALSLSGGEYVNITNQSSFNAANQGVFRVSTQAGFTPTATSFTVQRPTGAAVSESNVPTGVTGAIFFYAASSTTAAEIQAYVATNLTDVTATLVNDGGTSGAGIVAKSTYEDSNFVTQFVQLKDGINWIASSNLGGTPQFTFKKSLALSTDVGYAFNNGEEIRIVPTVMDQVQKFLSVLAVTGFTTLGEIGIVERGSRMELSTLTLGSDGSIQIVGGAANQYQVPVLDASIRLDNSIMAASVNQVASVNVLSDQWFRLQASLAQTKDALLSSNTNVTVAGNSPINGQSLITLSNRNLAQRNFGKPRNHIRTRNRTFRIEKQGSLVCLSWVGDNSSPAFNKSALNFNDSGGGTLNVSKVSGSDDAQYIILSGNANFTELSIGDLITVSGLPVAANNGTFLVTGVADNGKTVQVLNPLASNEFSFGTYTFSANSTAGDTFTIGGNALVAGTSFAIGGTTAQTAANLAAVIGTLVGVKGSSVGSVVTVTATTASASVSLAYSGTAVVTTSGASLVGQSFTAGQFAASSQVSEGDTVTISSPFNVLNQGRFRVIRRYGDSVWYENANVIEEEILLPVNSIGLGFDATTGFQVDATNNTLYMRWNGAGTEPTLGNAAMGDVIIPGTDFNAANQGSFMVMRAGAKQQEITQLTLPAGSTFTIGGAGKYFFIKSAGNLQSYYVWANVNGGNSDPSPGGTGIPVAILSGDNPVQVATKFATAINGVTGLTAVSNAANVTVTTTGYIETTHATNGNMPSGFSILLLQAGRRTFLEAINPSVVAQASVTVSGGTLVCTRPQIQFSEYEATQPGDNFVVTGNVLGTNNVGSYQVYKVLDRDTAIILGSLTSTINANLTGVETSVYVQEGVPYFGYKQVKLINTQPGANARNYVIFTTNAQYNKIDGAAGVQMISLNKLDFDTSLISGLDSYRFNTDLIQIANKIIYGDPTDDVTYSGVGAAGAEIFVQEPLTLRVRLSIDIRLQTGVPFASTVQQVRSSVGALINSNKIGQSISLSSIVSAINAIPGIVSCVITSPLYNASNDLIVVDPSEKTRVIDPTTDISVAQIGA